MYLRSCLKLVAISFTLGQKSTGNAGGSSGVSSSSGAEVGASGQTMKLIDVLDRATGPHAASRLLRTVSASSLVEAEGSVNMDESGATMNVADVGAKTVETSRQNSAQAASFHTTSSSKTSVWGFSDTCFSLYWFGYVTKTTCRDSWMPERTSSCRCERAGTAWPAKYCDASRQAGNTPDATTAASLFELDVIGGADPQTLQGMNLDKQEVFGLCEVCCERESILAKEAIAFPLMLIFCCCACCVGSFKALSQVRSKQKLLAKAQQASQAAQ